VFGSSAYGRSRNSAKIEGIGGRRRAIGQPTSKLKAANADKSIAILESVNDISIVPVDGGPEAKGDVAPDCEPIESSRVSRTEGDPS
jgi:hypothetical protein